MSTTLIFVEFLSAGTLAGIAILLALVGLGFDMQQLEQLREMQVIAVIAGIGFAYPLGIVIDSIADWMLSKVGSRYKNKYGLKDGHTVFSLFAEKRGSDFAEKYFDYNRTKTRMVRSFLLNSALMFVAGTYCGITLGWQFKWLVTWSIAWIIFMLLSYLALKQLSESWFRMLAVAWGDWPPPAELDK